MVQSLENKVSRRYARAFVELGLEQKNLDRLVKDIRDLEAMLKSSDDLRAFIATPLYRRKEREQAINAIARKAKFHSHTDHFLSVLAQHRRLNLLPVIISVMDEMVREAKGIQDIQVISAVKLKKTQETKLAKELKKAIGQDVNIQNTVNSNLLGGLVMHYESVRIDDSLKAKLERLTHTMKGTA